MFGLTVSTLDSESSQLPAALSWSSPARAPCMLYSTLRAYSDVSVSRFSVSHLPSTYIQFVSFGELGAPPNPWRAKCVGELGAPPNPWRAKCI
jgi:hypothetical protein